MQNFTPLNESTPAPAPAEDHLYNYRSFYLESEKTFILNEIEHQLIVARNFQVKWKRLANAHNTKFYNTLQKAGEKYGVRKGSLSMDRMAPWREALAMKRTVQTWVEFKELVARAEEERKSWKINEEGDDSEDEKELPVPKASRVAQQPGFVCKKKQNDGKEMSPAEIFDAALAVLVGMQDKEYDAEDEGYEEMEVDDVDPTVPEKNNPTPQNPMLALFHSSEAVNPVESYIGLRIVDGSVEEKEMFVVESPSASPHRSVSPLEPSEMQYESVSREDELPYGGLIAIWPDLSAGLEDSTTLNYAEEWDMGSKMES